MHQTVEECDLSMLCCNGVEQDEAIHSFFDLVVVIMESLL